MSFSGVYYLKLLKPLLGYGLFSYPNYYHLLYVLMWQSRFSQSPWKPMPT
jgi:hypothetical protein